MGRYILAMYVNASAKMSQSEYLKWAEANGFESMLPKDQKMRKQSAQQSQLDGHLQSLPLKPEKSTYSDEWFRAATVQWLVNTDQVNPLATIREIPS